MSDIATPDGPALAAHSEIREYRIASRGRNLCVRVCGDETRPAILLQHGIQSHAGVWEKIAATLADSGFYVVMPDRRGHGHSDHFDAYHLLDYVGDLDAVVRQLVDRPLLLLGHCESCLITALYAGANPEKIKAAAFVQFPVPPRQDMDEQTRADLLKTFLKKTARPQPHAVMTGLEDAAQRSIEASPFPMPQEVALHVARRNIRQVDGGYVWRWDPDILNYRLLYKTFDMSLVSAALAAITAPVLFLYGQDSSLIKLDKERHLAITRALKPEARQVLIPGGHYPHMERGSEVLAAILAEAAS